MMRVSIPIAQAYQGAPAEPEEEPVVYGETVILE
jgi:hypothetical protein